MREDKHIGIMIHPGHGAFNPYIDTYVSLDMFSEIAVKELTSLGYDVTSTRWPGGIGAGPNGNIIQWFYMFKENLSFIGIFKTLIQLLNFIVDRKRYFTRILMPDDYTVELSVNFKSDVLKGNINDPWYKQHITDLITLSAQTSKMLKSKYPQLTFACSTVIYNDNFNSRVKVSLTDDEINSRMIHKTNQLIEKIFYRSKTHIAVSVSRAGLLKREDTVFKEINTHDNKIVNYKIYYYLISGRLLSEEIRRLRVKHILKYRV
jgi:hypothetical protein